MNSSPGKRESTIPGFSTNLKACLCGILHRESDLSTPMSVRAIQNALDKEASLRTGVHFNVSKPTIRKALEDLFAFSTAYPDFFCLIYGGYINKYYLHPASTKGHPRYISAEEADTSGITVDTSANRELFYAFQSQFEPQELFSLLNGAEVNPYLSVREIQNLRQRLANAATPELVNQACNTENLSFDKELHIDIASVKLLKNLATLIHLLHMEYQIEINYGKYQLNPLTSGFELISTRTTASGLPKWQRLDPIAIFEANGFYYLAAHTDKSKEISDLAVYRIDRMIEIRPYKDISLKPLLISADILQYQKSFSALEYKKSHPVMYGGSKVDIRMLVCEDATFSSGNALLDTFGSNIHIRPISEQEAKQYFSSSLSELELTGEHWYMVSLHHSISGTVLWAKQHIDHVRLLSPPEAVDTLISAVSKGLSRY